MSSSRKGRAGERELRARFFELGFLSLTIPGQHGTDHDFDDHVFGNAVLDQLYAVECKRRSRSRFYIQSEQLETLTTFATQFARVCEPVVCVRWDQDTTWYMRHVDDLELTPSGNASIDPETSRAEWLPLSAYLKQRAMATAPTTRSSTDARPSTDADSSTGTSTSTGAGTD